MILTNDLWETLWTPLSGKNCLTHFASLNISQINEKQKEKVAPLSNTSAHG
tara:strand:- start:120 stop:272 length:153 start_codon:yes stop_codon:yes gene_type:complete